MPGRTHRPPRSGRGRASLEVASMESADGGAGPTGSAAIADERPSADPVSRRSTVTERDARGAGVTVERWKTGERSTTGGVRGSTITTRSLIGARRGDDTPRSGVTLYNERITATNEPQVADAATRSAKKTSLPERAAWCRGFHSESTSVRPGGDGRALPAKAVDETHRHAAHRAAVPEHFRAAARAGEGVERGTATGYDSGLAPGPTRSGSSDEAR